MKEGTDLANKFDVTKWSGKLTYGVGAVGLDVSYGMFYSYLAKYLTDVLRLDNRFLLLLTPLARIWDGINDPIMGTIVDNTRTRMGKYRPWIVIGTLTNAVVLALLFNNPGITPGSVWLYVYAAVLYVAWGMTNTMADIPYWSMVPSFTSDPKERSMIATVARTFSGLGQGLISIGAPLILPLFSLSTQTDANGAKVWDARSFGMTALVCSAALIFFSLISVSRTREYQVTAPKDKFSFKTIFRTVGGNDQLRWFMLFAMLSNAGFYMFSGVGAYFFDVVANDTKAQSAFSLFQAVGSVLGLLVIPVMMKFTSRRRIYQFSLALCVLSYAGMLLSFKLAGSLMLMNIFYLLGNIGSSSMFVSQTVFLADIVDYGEVKNGSRAESVTFSMKGFLQKMAYTIQTVILFAGLEFSHYDETLHAANSLAVKNTVTSMMLVVPIFGMLASLFIFTFKFKLHGKYMEEITAKVSAKADSSENANDPAKPEENTEQ